MKKRDKNKSIKLNKLGTKRALYEKERRKQYLAKKLVKPRESDSE